MLVPSIKCKSGFKKEDNTIIQEVNEMIRADINDVHRDVLTNDEVKEKYYKSIENIIRTSPEYRNYLYILKNEFDLTKCKFFKNINIIDTDVTIEFHHYPFTLYDIVHIVFTNKLNSLKDNAEKYEEIMNSLLNPYSIADEVMKLHFENLVGLVPLTETAHEIVHSGMAFIPLTNEFVFGNYKGFTNRYSIAFDNYTDKLKTLDKLTNQIVSGEKELDLSKFEIIKTEIKMEIADKPQEILIEENNSNIA